MLEPPAISPALSSSLRSRPITASKTIATDFGVGHPCAVSSSRSAVDPVELLEARCQATAGPAADDQGPVDVEEDRLDHAADLSGR